MSDSVFVAAFPDLEDQRRLAAVGPVGQRGRHGQPAPVEVVAQHRSLAAGRPGGPHRREKRESALVVEADPGAAAPGAFFIRGQSCFTQAATASSLRSTARRAGRCRLQPSRWRKIAHVWVCEYRTPVSRSITSATRASVHIPVANPLARGPAKSAASTPASCSSVSFGRRPARPAPARPRRPPPCQARYHRDAVCADTPSPATTSTCRLPRANISAARIRRAASPAKSRRTRPPPAADREAAAAAGTTPLSYPTRQNRGSASLYFRKIFNLMVGWQIGAPVKRSLIAYDH